MSLVERRVDGACQSIGILGLQTFCIFEGSEGPVSLLSAGFIAFVVLCLAPRATRAEADFSLMFGFVCEWERRLGRLIVWTNALQRYLPTPGCSTHDAQCAKGREQILLL